MRMHWVPSSHSYQSHHHGCYYKYCHHHYYNFLQTPAQPPVPSLALTTSRV